MKAKEAAIGGDDLFHKVLKRPKIAWQQLICNRNLRRKEDALIAVFLLKAATEPPGFQRIYAVCA
jgi:hypothetical protein